MTHIALIIALVFFVIATAASATYGIHMGILLILFARRQREVRARQQEVIEKFINQPDRSGWPKVTTQLPIYNEADVIGRLIEAVAAMDYPRDKHEIQVLDDSNDGTRDLVDRIAERYRAQGVNIKVVRRADRKGYKAGALAYGMKQAEGEFLAIFDADFVPGPEFLKRCVALAANDDGLACVQGRWAHLNRGESWLTQAQALGIDGHFAIEQGARAWNNLLMNFNGTAGLWRRAAIEDEKVGGWSADTLTEDLDLSYRVQLAGWRMEYCLDIPCPAELPGTANALKGQQRRWATGSIQVACKLLPRIWRAPLTLGQKTEATLHLTHYSISVFMLFLAIAARPMLLIWLEDAAYRGWFTWVWGIACATALVPSSVYTYARYVLGEGWGGAKVIPGMMVLGMGICLNNALAVVRGLHLKGGEFVRTPKSGSTGVKKTASRYNTMQSQMWLIELLLGVYSLSTFVAYLDQKRLFFSFFLLLYSAGFLAMAWASRPRPQRPSSSGELEVATLETAQS